MSGEPPDWFDRLHGGSRRRHGGSDEPVEMIEIAGEIKIDTGRAIHFYDGSKTVWLPHSQIEIIDGGARCPEWLAKANGLI